MTSAHVLVQPGNRDLVQACLKEEMIATATALPNLPQDQSVPLAKCGTLKTGIVDVSARFNSGNAHTERH